MLIRALRNFRSDLRYILWGPTDKELEAAALEIRRRYFPGVF